MTSSVRPTGKKSYLLVGMTGDGKSATGNSILGHKAFKTSLSFTSVTKTVELGTSTIDNVKVTVVDCPGLADTDLNEEEDIEQIVAALTDALKLCPEGFDAILYVHKDGERFTENRKRYLKVLKSVLGKDALQNHGIIIVTHADLDRDDNDSNLNEDPVFQDLLDECGNRVIVFDNRSKIKQKLSNQRRRLFNLQIKQAQTCRYSVKQFYEAKPSRLQLRVKTIEPRIRTEFQVKFDEISAKLSLIRNLNPEYKMKVLNNLKHDIDRFLSDIEEMDMGTNFLANIIQDVKILQNRLYGLQEMTKNDISHEQTKRKLAEEIEEVRETEKRRNRMTREEKKFVARSSLNIVTGVAGTFFVVMAAIPPIRPLGLIGSVLTAGVSYIGNAIIDETL